VLQWIGKTADKEDVSEIWFLGDLCHLKNGLDSFVIRSVFEELTLLLGCRGPAYGGEIPLRLLAGNHDYRQWDRGDDLIKTFQFLSEESLSFSGDAGFDPHMKRVFSIPYKRNADEVNKTIASLDDNQFDIFLGHQDIIGVQYGGFVVEKGVDPDLLKKKFKVSFIGHNHSPFHLKSQNVYSVGAPLQHTFSDMGSERRILIINTETLEVKSIANTFSPVFKELIIETGEEVVPEDSKNFYRVRIKTSKPIPSLDKITFKRIMRETVSQRKDRTSLSISDPKLDILKKYSEARVGNSGLDVKRLIETGGRYL
jgi:DNA repair exonuclease SbcCD nuclease subunit